MHPTQAKLDLNLLVALDALLEEGSVSGALKTHVRVALRGDRCLDRAEKTRPQWGREKHGGQGGGANGRSNNTIDTSSAIGVRGPCQCNKQGAAHDQSNDG